MGKQGTDIFGGRQQDPATAVLAVMRLAGRPPASHQRPSAPTSKASPRSRSTRPWTPSSAAHRTGHGSADPYKNFVWNVKRGTQRGRRNGRNSSQILSGLDRIRD